MLSLSVAIFACLVGAYLWLRVPRMESVAGVIVCAAIMWAVSLYSLGNARPITHDILASEKMSVIAFHLDEPRAIYIWTKSPSGPISYKLPWDIESAKQLHNAKREGGGLIEAKRERGTLEYGKWIFHPPAPTAYPPKDETQ